MTPSSIAIILLLCHFIGDWFLQTRYVAENKSKNFYVLIFHVAIVISVLQLGLIIIYGSTNFAIKIGIYALAHGLQDWFIWRFYTKFFHDPEKPDFKGKAFYNTIAVDQLLHLGLLVYLFL